MDGQQSDMLQLSSNTTDTTQPSCNTTHWNQFNASAEAITSDTLSGAEFHLTLAARVLLCVFVGVVGVTGVVSNSLVLLVILLTKSTRCVGSCFLINLVSSDLLLCATAFPAVLCDLTMGWRHGNKHMPQGVPCQLVGFLLSVFMYNSVTSLAAVSLHRYRSIVHCVQHQNSRLFSFAGLLLCWAYSVCWSIGPVFGWGSIVYMDSRFVCTILPETMASYTITHCLTQFFLPLITMVICYVKIVVMAYSHTRKIFDVTPQGHPLQQQVYHADPPFVIVQKVKRLALFPEYMAIPKQIVLTTSGGKPEISKQFYPTTTVNHCGSNESNGSVSNCSSSQRETQAMVKLLGLICVFVLTWLPLHVCNMVYLTYKGKISKTWDSVAFLLACVNSCLNPILFGLASDQFRQNMKRQLWPNKKHRVVQNEVVQKASCVSSVKDSEPRHKYGQNIDSSADTCLHQHQTAAVIHLPSCTLDEEEMKIMSYSYPHRSSQSLPSITSTASRHKYKQSTSKSIKTRKKKVLTNKLILPADIKIPPPHLFHGQIPLPPISPT